MSNKFILSALVAVIALAVFGIAEFSFIKNRHLSFLLATPQPSSTPPTPSRTVCRSLQGSVPTSTWKTFSDPNWEIKFQYPPTYQFVEKQGGSVTISGDGSSMIIFRDFYRSLVEEGGDYTVCDHVIAGNNVRVTIDPYGHPSSTFRYVTGFSKIHDYSIVVTGSVSSPETTDTILDTIELTKP